MAHSTIIPRLGNKQNSWKYIKDFFPDYIHHYCEPFLGSGFVLLQLKKANPNMYSIVGDIDNELGNFWYQSFNNTDALVELINSAPSSQGLYNMLGEMTELTDLQRAFKFYYLSIMSGPGGYTKTNKTDGNQLHITKDYLNKGQAMLKSPNRGICINKNNLEKKGYAQLLPSPNRSENRLSIREKTLHYKSSVLNTLFKGGIKEFFDIINPRSYFLQKDYKEIINYADHWKKPYTLYLDPPYVGTENYYKNSFNHQELYDFIKDREFILNYNDCKYIRDLYKDFYIRGYSVKNRKELVISTQKQGLW